MLFSIGKYEQFVDVLQITDFGANISPDVFEESGCVVCGKLTPIVRWKICLKLKVSICSMLMELLVTPDLKPLIQ